jgi:hypothetical protein
MAAVDLGVNDYSSDESLSDDDDGGDVEAMNPANEPAAKAAKLVPSKKTAVKRFKKYTEMFLWLVDTDDALKYYLQTAELKCSFCDSALAVDGRKSVLVRHGDTVGFGCVSLSLSLFLTHVYLFIYFYCSHKKQQEKKARNGPMDRFVEVDEAAAAADAQEQRRVAKAKLRALTSVSLLTEGLAPNTMARIFAKGSPIATGLYKMKDSCTALGVPATIRADMEVVCAAVEQRMTAAFKGKWFALVTDGATFKHGSKAVAILLASLELKCPALLVLEHPADGDVYDNAKCADDVRQALAKFEVDLSQVLSKAFIF